MRSTVLIGDEEGCEDGQYNSCGRVVYCAEEVEMELGWPCSSNGGVRPDTPGLEGDEVERLQLLGDYAVLATKTIERRTPQTALAMGFPHRTIVLSGSWIARFFGLADEGKFTRAMGNFISRLVRSASLSDASGYL